MSETELPSDAQKRRVIGGHLRDAYMQFMAVQYPNNPVPTVFEFERMARYLIESGSIDNDFEGAYRIIEDGVQRALDIRDGSGTPLRDALFSNKNGNNYYELQQALLTALKDAYDQI